MHAWKPETLLSLPHAMKTWKIGSSPLARASSGGNRHTDNDEKPDGESQEVGGSIAD